MRIIQTCDDDIRLRDIISLRDPFQLGSPSWLVRVWNLLPPDIAYMRPTRQQLLEKDLRQIMAIRVVETKQAPERFHKRGTVTNTQDWTDVMQALRDLPAGKAIV